MKSFKLQKIKKEEKTGKKKKKKSKVEIQYTFTKRLLI